MTDLVDGKTWADAAIVDSEKSGVIEKLIDAVEHLHGLGISHGDLHPGNVMLDRENGNVYLIDIPDFSHNTAEARNHRYSPENIDGSSSEQRDNFAVLRMSCELLGLDWGEESKEYPRITDAILSELNDIEFGFKDLGRFKKAQKTAIKVQEQQFVEITLNNTNEQMTILPDNGHLYVKVEATKNGKRRNYSVMFSGIGGSFVVFYDKEKRCFVGGLSPRIRSDVNFRVAEESQFEISTAIRIKPGRPAQFSSLSEHLRDNDAFFRAIEVLQAVPPEIDE